MAKPKYIESPEKMWELFTAYKKEVKDNPIQVEDYVGKDAIRVLREREQPLIMEGFECFVMDNTQMTYPDLSHYFANTKDSYANYFAICSRIKREIRADQIKLGLANVINPSITQRLNNLVERTDTTTNGKEVTTPIFGTNPLENG